MKLIRKKSLRWALLFALLGLVSCDDPPAQSQKKLMVAAPEQRPLPAPVAWQQLEKGMTLTQALSLLPTPSQVIEYGEPPFQIQSYQWHQGPHHLQVEVLDAVIVEIQQD